MKRVISVTIARNEEKLIPEMIKLLRLQIYSLYKIIVVNDGLPIVLERL